MDAKWFETENRPFSPQFLCSLPIRRGVSGGGCSPCTDHRALPLPTSLRRPFYDGGRGYPYTRHLGGGHLSSELGTSFQPFSSFRIFLVIDYVVLELYFLYILIPVRRRLSPRNPAQNVADLRAQVAANTKGVLAGSPPDGTSNPQW